MRKRYVKASRVPSPHLVRMYNSGKISKDVTNAEDTGSLLVFWQAIDVTDNRGEIPRGLKMQP